MSGQSAAKTVFELLEVYVQWPHDKVAISFWGSPFWSNSVGCFEIGPLGTS